MVSPLLDVIYDGLNKFLFRLLPHWTQGQKDERIFMWDPIVMLAAKVTGLLDPHVWHKPSHQFDYVFVYSTFSSKMLSDSNYPMEIVKEVGVPLLDQVIKDQENKSARENIFSELGMSCDDPFLLFNDEPSAEHH